MGMADRMREAAKNKPKPAAAGPRKEGRGKSPQARDELFEKFRLPNGARLVAEYDEAKKVWVGQLLVGYAEFHHTAEGVHRLVHELGRMWKKSQQPKPEEKK